MKRNRIVGLAAIAFLCCGLASADEIDDHLAAIARTGPMGAGSAEARAARDQLLEQNVAILPRLLEAMDTTNVVAANWYRTVYEHIVSEELGRDPLSFPNEFLRAYVR